MNTEEIAALLINTKVRVCVKCHRVFECTRRAHINFQPSTGHCFALIITATYTLPRRPGGIKISEARWRCRVITNRRKGVKPNITSWSEKVLKQELKLSKKVEVLRHL